jgi:hypothetical protein
VQVERDIDGREWAERRALSTKLLETKTGRREGTHVKVHAWVLELEGGGRKRIGGVDVEGWDGWR